MVGELLAVVVVVSLIEQLENPVGGSDADLAGLGIQGPGRLRLRLPLFGHSHIRT